MIRAELLDLAEFDVTEFPLDAANDAVAHAAAHTGALKLTVIRPYESICYFKSEGVLTTSKWAATTVP